MWKCWTPRQMPALASNHDRIRAPHHGDAQTTLRFVATHDVHIWFRATDGLDAAAIEAAAAVLSDEERAQYARFHFVRDARDYAAAHALLRTVLSHGGDLRPESWQFDRTPRGKPFLIGQGEA